MDSGEDWSQVFDAPWPGFSIWNANLLCHSDRGTRAGSCSAAGWYIEAIETRDGKPHTFPVAMAGIFMAKPISSFTAETVALQEAILDVSVQIQTSGRHSTKRARVGPGV